MGSALKEEMKKPTILILRILDYAILPIIIFLIAYDPNFSHGTIVSMDEGAHLAWINGILQGKVPYRDMYIGYGPFLEYLPALLMKIFRPTIVVLRAYWHFGTIFTLILGYFLSRAVIRTRFFVYLATWLLIAMTIIPSWTSRWGGIRVGTGLVVLLCLIAYMKRRSKIWLYFGGLATAFSILTSPEIGIFAFIAAMTFLIGLNFAKKSFRSKIYLRELFLYLAGMVTIFLAFIIYYLSVNAFLDYLKINFIDFPFKLAKTATYTYPFLPLLEFFQYVLNTLKYFWISPEVRDNTFHIIFTLILSRTFLLYLVFGIYIISAIYLTVKIVRKKFNFIELTILTLVVFGFPLLKAGMRAFGGIQFNYALTPVVILSSLLLEKVALKTEKAINAIKDASWNYKLLYLFKSSLFLLILILSFTYIIISTKATGNALFKLKQFGPKEKILFEEKQFGNKSFQIKSLDIERGGGIFLPAKQAKIITEVVDFISKNTKSDEPIFTFPHEGHYYFLADRRGATRFDTAVAACISPEYSLEVINDLERYKPRYIVYVTDSYMFPDYNPISNEERIPQIVSYIKRNYQIEKEFKGTLIMKRKN